MFQHRWNPFRASHQPGTRGIVDQNSWSSILGSILLLQTLKAASHMCPFQQALQRLAWNFAFCMFLPKTSTMDHIVCGLYSYVNCWGLCPTQHSDATKPKCSAPSRREALLFHRSDSADRPGQFRGQAQQLLRDKWAACTAFLLLSPASVYHLFSISALHLPFF